MRYLYRQLSKSSCVLFLHDSHRCGPCQVFFFASLAFSDVLANIFLGKPTTQFSEIVGAKCEARRAQNWDRFLGPEFGSHQALRQRFKFRFRNLRAQFLGTVFVAGGPGNVFVAEGPQSSEN